MADISLRPLRRDDPVDRRDWRRVLDASADATLFHDPDFLDYHGDRFEEHHYLVLAGMTPLAVLPMAIVAGDDGRWARSPYGGSYGGFVFQHPPNYRQARDIAAALVGELATLGVAGLRITPAPTAWSDAADETMTFALIEQGFRFTSRDVTSAVTLDPAMGATQMSSRARNMARKAEKLGVEARMRAPLDDFWPLMELTFGRHGARPTHERAQWAWLMDKLPDRVWVDVAYLDGRPVAGVGHLACTPRVDSSFYLCSDPDARDSQALTYLLAATLEQSHADGYRIFDFGTSSVNGEGRENIFRYKESFGAISMFRHVLELDLA